MLAYLPFSIRREDLPQNFLLKSPKDSFGKKKKPSTFAHGGKPT